MHNPGQHRREEAEKETFGQWPTSKAAKKEQGPPDEKKVGTDCRKTLGFVVCVCSMQRTEMNCTAQWCELQSSTNYGANPNVTQPYERVTFAKGHVAGTRARDANSGLVKFKTWWGTLDRNGPRFASLAPPLGCDDTIVATGTASATLSLSHHMPLRSFCISSGIALLLPVSHPSKPSKENACQFVSLRRVGG